jgi:hypothetical protein
MAINSTSPTTFTSGVLITDTTNSVNGARGVIENTITPSTALDIQSTEGALVIPRLTTAQRDILTPSNGMMVYNTTTNKFNVFQNEIWDVLETGTVGGDATYILQTPDTDLPNAQALSALTTGVLKSTTTTGVVTIATDIIEDGNSNLFVGTGSGNLTLTGTDNTSLGTGLPALTTGEANIGIGTACLASTTTGSRNIAIGRTTLQLISSSDNIAIGADAMDNATNASGGENIAIGTNSASAHVAYTNCVFIGYDTDTTVNNLTNAVAIGHNADVAISNAMRLGNGCKVGVNLDTPTAALSVGVVGTEAQLFLANSANANPGNPTGGGMLFVNAGDLYYIGPTGTPTLLATG